MGNDWNALLVEDHERTERVLAAMEKAFAAPQAPAPALVEQLRRYLCQYVEQCHNRKEEEHLFPRLEARGLPRAGGPLAVMLAEHEQVREHLARLDPLARAYSAGDSGQLAPLRVVFTDYAALCKSHFWKENDILYPMARRLLDPSDAEAVVTGIEQLERALAPASRASYYALADEIIAASALRDLSFNLDPEVMAALLNTLPLELSFVDHEDTVRYFSHELAPKIFPRTRGAIGTKVQDCHPAHSVDLVERILADFKAGRREVAAFWIDLNGRKIHIRYWPVRDPQGRYLGCLETVQDVTGIQQLVGQHRLLDEQ
ncbi:MAG: DUF438 domain-containing protein [Proteobacteria bacterium]|nr:DUF438 domain-containing protein [Pseudomonadota bacterium]